MEVSCALCECSSPPIERSRLNLVFLHLSAAQNDLEHATCASYPRKTPSSDQCHMACFFRAITHSFDIAGSLMSLTDVLAFISWSCSCLIRDGFQLLIRPPYSTNCAGGMLNRRKFSELREILTKNFSPLFLPIGILIRPMRLLRFC